MGMNFRLLRADEIDVKVKQVTAKGAIALIYKTSRVDMDILDETVGADNWTDDYKEIKGNLYCGIGIRENSEKPFVWKWDCGIESRSDDEGNEKKGEASDAFKRSAVKWGIGRELYSAPFIFIKAETILDGKKYKLADPYVTYEVSQIDYDDNRKITALKIVSSKGESVYSYADKGANSNNVKPIKVPQYKPKNEEKTDDNGKTFVPITKDEIMRKYGVKNVQETIVWFEGKFGVEFANWGEDECELARLKLQEKKDKREAEERRQSGLDRLDDADLPFSVRG